MTNKEDLAEIYRTGSGKIKVRGKVEIEKAKGGRQNIVISEIPYPMIGANIGKFLNDVYGLVESKKTSDIIDISNQSSKDGIRIVIELKRGADAENICNLLYKKTRLEDTFGVNMLAVAQGRPETLGIIDIIRHNVNFQYELATRKYTHLLAKERDKCARGLAGSQRERQIAHDKLRQRQNCFPHRIKRKHGYAKSIRRKN